MKKVFLLFTLAVFSSAFFSSCTKAVEGVSLNKNALTLEIGQSEDLVESILPSDADILTCTWTSSNPTLVAVDNSGLVTALAAGSAIVKVKTNDGGFEASCLVTVNKNNVNVTQVSLNKNSSSLQVGGTEQLICTVLPNNADDVRLIWVSSNTSIATVSSTGLVTAVSAGNVVIDVTSVDGNKKATCSYTITNKVVEKNKELMSYYRKSRIDLEGIMRSLSFEYLGVSDGMLQYYQRAGNEERYYTFVFNSSNQATECGYWLFNKDTEAKNRYITQCKLWGDEINTIGFNDYFEGYIKTSILVDGVPRVFTYPNRTSYLLSFEEYRTSLLKCYENRRQVSAGMSAWSYYQEINTEYSVSITFEDISSSSPSPKKLNRLFK